MKSIIKCDCGGILEEKKTRLSKSNALAMVCPKCGFTTFTKEQAMLALSKMKGAAKRKISDEEIHSAREKAFLKLKKNLR